MFVDSTLTRPSAIEFFGQKKVESACVRVRNHWAYDLHTIFIINLDIRYKNRLNSRHDFRLTSSCYATIIYLSVYTSVFSSLFVTVEHSPALHKSRIHYISSTFTVQYPRRYLAYASHAYKVQHSCWVSAYHL